MSEADDAAAETPGGRRGTQTGACPEPGPGGAVCRHLLTTGPVVQSSGPAAYVRNGDAG